MSDLDMMEGVFINQSLETPPPEYKHDADRTLLPHLKHIRIKIQKFKEFSKKALPNTQGENAKILQHYININFQIRYDFAKIRYINNFNNDRGNKLVEKLFLSFEEFFSYFDKQYLINFNSVDDIDPGIRERSIKLCNKIITNIKQLTEYIEGEIPPLDTRAKGKKKYRSRCPNGTRKNKKMGKCEKKKSRKSSKSKKSKKSTMKNKNIS